MESLGVTSGEISQRKARDIYGKYFTDAVSREDSGLAGWKTEGQEQSGTGWLTSSPSRRLMLPGRNSSKSLYNKPYEKESH